MDKRRKIILDCDPGQDDMVAIILAGKSEAVELLAITVVAGNHTLENTTRNALNITQHLGLSVPVYAGCSGPLVRDKITAGEIHGETGLDGPVFAPLTKKKEAKHAVNYLIDTLMASDGDITMVVTGPMTNLAMALRMEPEIAGKIKEIIFMGGSYTMGNVTPAAEFNMFADPEAAHICLTSGIPMVMVGLDVTLKALVNQAYIEKAKTVDNPATSLFVPCMEFYMERESSVYGITGAPVHDPVTIAYLIDPSVLTLKEMNVVVDISGGTSYGRTNCDVFNKLDAEGAVRNVKVAIDIDSKRFWDIVWDEMNQYSA